MLGITAIPTLCVLAALEFWALSGFAKVLLSRHSLEVSVIMLVLATSFFVVPFLDVAVSGANTTPAYAPDRSKSPTDIQSAPSPAERVVVTLVTEEVVGQLADGVTYTFWTFNGTVPGPFIRLRLNQTVEMHIKNLANSTMTHSIDSHAILGTGGGSAFSQTPPGQESIFQFKAMRAGLFMYHCASPDIPTHIANGMYGLILVEPKDGLPKVDREFYIAQGEFYTQGPYGQQGHQGFSFQKADAETPEYVVFNGRVGALTGNRTLQAKVGETVRIFFLNAGPNLISSFHIIGGILDRVYVEGSIVSPPLLNVQTTLVPAGGAVMVEFTAEVPSKLTLVDHALFRIHHGAIGMINLVGAPNPDVFSSIKNATITTPNMNMNENTTQSSTSPSVAETASGSAVVVIQNYAFTPAKLTITAGTTVTWTNKDSVGHTVTEGNPESPKSPSGRVFDSSHGTSGADVITIPPGQSWSFTFTTPGEYDYYCIPHPYMTGHISVQPSGTNASQSYGYGDLSNFYVVLTGRELLGLSAFGIIVLVSLMMVLTRSAKKEKT
jgi:nitrite reductase (NO-forming)